MNPDIPHGAHDRWLEPPEEWQHHEDCQVLTALSIYVACECEELRKRP